MLRFAGRELPPWTLPPSHGAPCPPSDPRRRRAAAVPWQAGPREGAPHTARCPPTLARCSLCTPEPPFRAHVAGGDARSASAPRVRNSECSRGSCGLPQPFLQGCAHQVPPQPLLQRSIYEEDLILGRGGAGQNSLRGGRHMLATCFPESHQGLRLERLEGLPVGRPLRDLDSARRRCQPPEIRSYISAQASQGEMAFPVGPGSEDVGNHLYSSGAAGRGGLCSTTLRPHPGPYADHCLPSWGRTAACPLPRARRPTTLQKNLGNSDSEISQVRKWLKSRLKHEPCSPTKHQKPRVGQRK